MRALAANKTAYLSVSFVLLLLSMLLISVDTAAGAAPEAATGASGTGSVLLWTGFAGMTVGIVILPIQRLLTGTDDEDPESPDDD